MINEKKKWKRNNKEHIRIRDKEKNANDFYFKLAKNLRNRLQRRYLCK